MRLAGFPASPQRIFDVVDGMRARGIDSIRFNTVIRDDNLDQLLPIVHRAAELGCGVNFSLYTDAKNGKPRIPPRSRAAAAELDAVIAALLAYKRAPTRRDHELRLLSRTDSAVRAWRGPRAVSVGYSHDPIGSDRPGETVP